MSIALLQADLTDPRLVDFVAAWDKVRGDRFVPRWRDLDVPAMKHVLPYIWAWEYERDSDVFTGKLAGEEVLDVIGRGFRGAKAHEFYTPAQYEAVYGWSKRVIIDQVGVVITGPVYSHMHSGAIGQRVGLPVALLGEEADIILGVTLFDFGEARAQSIRGSLTFETMKFFSLER
jgi:hypothetical protein